jgi:hypothetical protein
MGLGKSLKKLAGSGLSPLGSLMYKKDGSTRKGFKSAAKALSPAYALMSKSSGGDESDSAEPEKDAPEIDRPYRGGMMGRVPMSSGLLSQVAANRSMRGASTQGMKSGGKVKGFRDGGIYTAEMGQPPQDIDGGSASLKKPAPKKTQAKKPAPKKPVATKNFAKGGSIDGIAQRGKTNCKMR